ncbi:hypothetical protein DXG03_001923 [Asterophora parasitica]|uniref:SH3 domain-containing protein n=1 Tax=Asterophora parasitica TaxID=117018 RepID=A0A9P7K8Y1_9AGAR|nr:hypothetical protein DXG03_001923 [Asterophora parasitica]
MTFQHRPSAERARHRKRIPQVFDDDGVLPGPITLTVTEVVQESPSSSPVVTPTVTVFVPPGGPASSSSSSPSPDPTIDPSSGTDPTVPIERPTPSISANNDGGETNPIDTSGANASSSTGIPAGSVVGIVLALVVLISAGIIIWLRRRAIAKRVKKSQAWTNKPSHRPSLSWIGPKDVKGDTLYPNKSSTAPPTMAGGPPQSLTFGPSANGLSYMPSPVPPRPPRAAGMFDNPPTPTIVSPVMSPSSGRLAPFASPIPADSGKVISTFIPTLPDELSISVGEVIRVHAEYDDGWAMCSNARGETGMVPLECLDRSSSSPNTLREFKKLARVSSLAPNPYGGYY